MNHSAVFLIKQSITSIALLLALCLSCATAVAEIQYIDDKLYALVRTGESGKHSIMHKGLVSGTQVEVMSTNKESGFSFVTLPDGREGYILRQYLTSTPIARDRLAEAKRTIATLTSKSEPAQKQLLEVREKNQKLERQVTNLSTEKERISQQLAEIVSVSKNAVATNRRNKTLIQENESHKSKVDVLKADNDRLKQKTDQEWFVNGAGAVLLGVLLALIIPRLTPKKKRSDWG